MANSKTSEIDTDKRNKWANNGDVKMCRTGFVMSEVALKTYIK